MNALLQRCLSYLESHFLFSSDLQLMLCFKKFPHYKFAESIIIYRHFSMVICANGLKHPLLPELYFFIRE
jgi:hypothetical protein